MRNNPVRMAWSVLITAFISFCLLAISIPLGTRWYLLNAAENQNAQLRVNTGTVLVLTPESDEPIAVVDARSLRPVTQIQTDQSSQATLVFRRAKAVDSPELATVQIYPSAQVELMVASQPRFAVSDDPYRISLTVRGGRVRVNASDPQPRGLDLQVQTPQAVVTLASGSYAVDVTNDQTMVATRFGEATIDAAGAQRTVGEGQRSTVALGQQPTDPVSLPENLIANGDFQEPLGPPTWLVSAYPEDDATQGTVQIVEQGGRNAAQFTRINQPPTHTEVAITQVLDRNVHDYQSLNLQMDVLVRWQSLPGAGEQSSEFPLMLWLDYVDIYGNHQFWTHGFYYRDPPPQWVVTGGTKIAQNVWFPFESGNLLERLPQEGRPQPGVINWIKIYASGHNYDSLATEIRLVAQ
jgi:hypothetical protein